MLANPLACPTAIYGDLDIVTSDPGALSLDQLRAAGRLLVQAGLLDSLPARKTGETASPCTCSLLSEH